MKSHQENQHEKEKNWDRDMIYCCTKCKFETRREKKLTNHIKERHEQFSCKECDVNFDSRYNLRRHNEKEHTTVECDICNFKFDSSRELEKHVKSRHNKMFMCEKCQLEVTSKKALQAHIEMEHCDNMKFKCKKCHYETILEQNLIEHKQNKHNNDRDQPPLRNAPCIYWNHGNCAYGVKCKFSHVEIPECYHQDRCRDSKCPWYHYDKSLNTFLGRGQKRNPTRKY